MTFKTNNWNQPCLLIMFCLLASCSNPASKQFSAQPDIQLKNNQKSAFRSFEDGSRRLRKAFAESGYDTSEGDHSIGNSASYLAIAVNNKHAEIRVNTAWNTTEPLGSFTELDYKVGNDKAIRSISRSDVKGVWVECRNFQFELLSTSSSVTIFALQLKLRHLLGCQPETPQ